MFEGIFVGEANVKGVRTFVELSINMRDEYPYLMWVDRDKDGKGEKLLISTPLFYEKGHRN